MIDNIVVIQTDQFSIEKGQILFANYFEHDVKCYLIINYYKQINANYYIISESAIYLLLKEINL